MIIHLQTTEEFRDEYQSSIESHIIVEVSGWFVDLNLNKFAEHRERVVIDDRTGTLRRRIHGSGGTVTERGIRLDTDTEDGSELYLWLHTTADNLLASFPTVGQ
ncbi:hypothetical protein DK749_24975 [Salmonella enterica subsp. salamae]|nr:hypothetical protein [Salmonella enterica subsp. salamae]